MSVHKQGHIIDPDCPQTGELVEADGLVYSCNLNQTDIDANKNKFYIIQLIKSGNQYILYTKYGRLGEKGKPSTQTLTSEIEGKTIFAKQFKAKTGNVWGTKNFVKKDTKYFLSQISYEDDLKNVKIDDTKMKIPDSKLDKRVQDLIKMLSDIKSLEKTLISLEIDIKKLPLGKIKQSQLKSAEDKLNEIAKMISETDDNSDDDDSNDIEEDISLNQLTKESSSFYTMLPMAFGRKRPPVIDTTEMIQKYKDIITELKNIAVTVKIQADIKVDENPLDSIYSSMNTFISPVDKMSKTWLLVDSYIKSTHGPTHGPKLELLELFEIEQKGKKELFDKYCEKIGNKQLLYHGTGMTNIISIFKNGMYLDPAQTDSKIAISGRMFGMGIYKSSCATKSFNYCKSEISDNIGTLILSEVALGKQYDRVDADWITKDMLAKKKYDSVKGVGQYESVDTNAVVIDNNIKIPMGPLKMINRNNNLYYNEYILFDVNQFLIKFLVIVKNVGGRSNY